MKEVKFIKTRTAILIVLIEIVLVMTVVISFVEKYYQKEYVNVPEVAVYRDNQKVAELKPMHYTWNYKGETNKYNEPIAVKQGNITLKATQYADFDFTEENTIIIPTHPNSEYVLKMKERHKIVEYSEGYRPLLENMNWSSSASGIVDISRLYLKGTPLNTYSSMEVGEYVYTNFIDFLKQGEVEYCMKVIAFDEGVARVAKEYLNTSLENTEKIEEFAKKIEFNVLFQSAKVEDKNLTLEYKYHIDSNSLRMNNLALFTCIPDLETVTYAPINKKTIVESEETYGMPEKAEVEQVVYTREEVDTESLANIENLKKFIDQL